MNKIVFTLKDIDSKSELLEILRQSKVKHILLGEDSTQSKSFFEISIKNPCTNNELLKVGIISEGHGLKPQYTNINLDTVIIGFNNEIYTISLNSINVMLKKRFESLLYGVQYIEKENKVLVICEANIYYLNQDLSIIWKKDMDLIIDYETTDNYIKVKTEEEKKTISIKDGHLIEEK